MKQISILAFVLSMFLLNQNLMAQSEVSEEPVNLEQETDSITLDGSDLEMNNVSDSELEESADSERTPASDGAATESTPDADNSAESSAPEATPSESSIGELTLTPEDEQMAEAEEPKAEEAKAQTLPAKTEEEKVVQPMFNFEEKKAANNAPIPDTKPDPVAAGSSAAASASTTDLGPVVGDQKYKITCQLNDDVREITAIQQADGSVGVVYKRFDVVKTIAIARRDPAYADQVVDKIYNNLANGKYPYACKKD